MKKILLLIVMILLPLAASAYDFEVDGFYYSVLSKEDKTCQIDGGTSVHQEGDLIIPATVTHNDTTFSVVKVNGFGRYSSKSGYIESVIIPEGVKIIGNSAFSFQTKLNYVSLPNSVERIEESAFGRCPLLKMRKLVLPKNLKYLGYSSFGEDMYSTKDSIVTLVIQENVDSIDAFAFSAMKNLQKVIILTNEPPTTYDSSGRSYGPFFGTGNPILYSSWNTGYWQGLYGEKCEYISNYFEEDGITYLPTSISPMTCDVIDCDYSSNINPSLIIPSEVTHSGVTFKVNNVKSYSFNSNEYIKEIICNNNGSVEASAFDNCTSLVSITFGDNITSIGSSVLEKCTNLTKVVLGQSINSIPDKAFANCENLSEVAYRGGIREIGSQAFMNCTNLIKFNLPDNLESIRYSCFQNCKKLDKITIPISVSTIESSAFQGCASISNIVIPNSVISIGNSLFEECTNLKRVKLSDGITFLQPIFKGCISLNEIELGKNIKTIEESTFENLTNLGAISIPCSVESIGNRAFSGCTSLKELTIEKGEVTLLLGYNKSEVFEVGKNTFSDCPLETIFLGRNISYESSLNFGYSPFYKISSLKNVIFDNTITTITKNLFKDCIGLTSVTISDSTKSIEESAFQNCSSLTMVTIGSGVNSINSAAFGSCAKLSDVFCFAKDVPVTENNAFQDSHIETATLHVLNNSINFYKESNPWKNFKNIVKIDMPEHTLTYIVDEEVYKTYQLEEGETITPEEAPTKEGYTFSGWSEIPETMPAHDVTVTGTFSINKYKLTYTVDGTEYKTYEVEYGATITPEEAPTKEGYTFSGWSEIPETMPAHDVTVTGTFTQVIYDIDDVTYEITGEGTVSIKGGEQKGEVTIEATIVINGQTYRVTAIADNAFKDNKDITSLTIPEGIATIGDNAFDGCTGLILINIGKDIQSIGNKAFANFGTVSAARTRSAESSIVVNCYAESVPQTALDAFENTPIETASLFVDDNSVNAYKTTSPWSGFGKIMGFDEAAGINSITIGTANAHIYDMQGNRLDNVRKGVNIIRMKDGKTKKVMVK